MARIVVDVGVLLRGQLKQYLDGRKFNGADLEYLEQKGWVNSIFTIKGSDKEISRIHKIVKLNE